MAGRDSWDDDRWDERAHYRSGERSRGEAGRERERSYGPAPAIGPTGIASSYNQTGDFGTSGRYYEDYEARAGYGGYAGSTPDYGPGGGERAVGSRRYYRRRPDPSQRPDYRERDIVGDDEVIGPYTEYGRAYSGYGAGGGYTPDYREGLGRERRSWSDRTSDEMRSWFGDRRAEQRRDWDAMETAGDHHRGRGPKGYQRSDERIREDVSDRLTDDPIVDASEIEVSVAGGEVTLNGAVFSKTAKRRAEDCADDVTGVTHVQNNLRVREHPRAGTVGAQTDPRVAAVSEGRDPDRAARDLGDDRGGPRLGALRPDA
ncbi:MAG TPA: BON domain-containing protein [Caulobacteraceae bacterium]|jgi:osmotically-inducible protein OsmY|nr:BON domain-containing protein [Caulobacteraceae bacterium]